MYGNFTSNLFKLSFTNYIFKYAIETQPPIPETPEIWDSFTKKIKSTLLSIYKMPSVLIKQNLYTNQQIPPQFVLSLDYENVMYSIIFPQGSNPFLTEKNEQKDFLQSVFKENLQEMKYFYFENAFYNPFEVFEEKPLEIVRWNGFSFAIQRLSNDFALQIIPKTLILNKKNCFLLFQKLKERFFEVSDATIKKIFQGFKVQVKPHKDLDTS